MAPVSLLSLGFLLSFLHPSDAQTIIGSSSSFSRLDLPTNSSPHPTKQTAKFWTSLPPRGRSDVPIRATVRNRLTTTNAMQQDQRMPHPTAQSTSYISALSTHNLSGGPILTQPTVSRPRTDTAFLLFSRAAKRDDTTKGSTPPLPTLSFTAVAQSVGDKPVKAGNSGEGSVKDTGDDDFQALGSGSIPTVTLVKDESPVPTVGDEMAQDQPQAQTAISNVSDVQTPPPNSQTLKPQMFVLTTSNKIFMTPQTETRATPSPRTVVLTGEKSNILERTFHESKVLLRSKFHTM